MDANWGADIVPYRQISEGFVASLAPFSAFDRILSDNSFLRTPFKTLISVASSAAVGSSISELAPKPLTKLAFTRAILEPIKALAFLVINEELAKSALPAAVSMIGNELRRACALATDKAFLAAIGESTGVASNASSGYFNNDLVTALQSISLGANSRLYLILPPNICKDVALVRNAIGNLLYTQMTVGGGTIQGIKVIVSDASTDVAYLLDASQVAAENEIVNLAQADYASVEMDDNPTSGATSLVSLWQAGMTGMRAERWFGVELLRSDAVALITGLGEVTA
jgi:HK97 family phage major capsid protein